MSDDAKTVLGEVDALVATGRRRERMNAARLRAIDEGRDPEVAAREAVRDPDEPQVHPVEARRSRVIDAALKVGRLTPAEAVKVRAAMDVDEQAATAMLARLPEGRLPLEPQAMVPDPENPLGEIAPGETLPDGLSLLSASERAAVEERRQR